MIIVLARADANFGVASDRAESVYKKPDFGHVGKAFVSCRGSPNVCRKEWDDDNDHGTRCAGIADAIDNTEGVVGVSTEATLHAVKVLDKSGSGSFSDVADGIRWTADQGYDVGSMSLGGSSSSTVKDACQYACDKGVLLVAAAGNDGPCSDCVSYPVAYQEVIAVSATSCDDSPAGFSSTGREVELAGPARTSTRPSPGAATPSAARRWRVRTSPAPGAS